MTKEKAGPRKPRNFEISPGIMRFSRSQMIHKKALYRKMKPLPAKEAKPAPKPSKTPRLYETEVRKASKQLHPKKLFSKHVRRLRSTITPGTVLIVLTGIHRGKRIVFLKQLDSGMLLCTGPYKMNGVPLRRFNQTYVLATRTKLDVSHVKLPDYLNDDFFKREKKDKKSKDTTDQLFQSEKEVYTASAERKEAQKGS